MFQSVQQQIQSNPVNYQSQQMQSNQNQADNSPRPEFFDQQRANQGNI
jgi:hypothetical protein